MSGQEARAWWTEVEHLRPDADRRAAAQPRHLHVVEEPHVAGEPPAPRERDRSVRVADDAVRQHGRRPAPARRTVEIRGRVADRSLPPARRQPAPHGSRRPARRPAERLGPRPDRIAMWAVLLGLFLIVVAAVSGG